MKRLLIFLLLLLSGLVFAQEATPETTPEATAEATAEFTPEATAAVLAEVTPESTSIADQCPMLVDQAIQATQFSCGETGLNEACYGFVQVDAELINPESEFIAQGDKTDIVNIQSIQLSPMDVLLAEWGVMVMSVEAEAADGQTSDVQMILYGDTNVESAIQFVEVTATAQANIRRYPRTDGEILDVLSVGESRLANARLEDDSWIRIRIDGEDTPVGWISTQFLQAATDIEYLPAFTRAQAEEPPTDIGATYGPMQAMIIDTSGDAPPCSEAPNNGLLIQTPEGVASVTIWLDEVVIQLNGTGVVTAEAGNEMSVIMVDGSAQVTAEGQTTTIVEGQATDIELDENLSPVAPPTAPRPITEDEVNGLPTPLLDDAVTIPEVTETSSLLPFAGQWSYTLNSPAPYICSDGSTVEMLSSGVPATITPQLDALNVSGLLFPQVSEGVYRGGYPDGNGNLVQDTLQVVRTDRITGERTIDFPLCTITVQFTYQLIAPN